MTESLSPSALAIVCQIQAIATTVESAASELSREELVKIGRALACASDSIDNRIGWWDTFRPTNGRAA